KRAAARARRPRRQTAALRSRRRGCRTWPPTGSRRAARARLPRRSLQGLPALGDGDALLQRVQRAMSEHARVAFTDAEARRDLGVIQQLAVREPDGLARAL